MWLVRLTAEEIQNPLNLPKLHPFLFVSLSDSVSLLSLPGANFQNDFMATECPNCRELVSYAAGLLFRPGILVCVCLQKGGKHFFLFGGGLGGVRLGYLSF